MPPFTNWRISSGPLCGTHAPLELQFNQQARRLQRQLPNLELGPLLVTCSIPSLQKEFKLHVAETTCDAQIVAYVLTSNPTLSEEDLFLRINGQKYALNSREAVK